MIQEEIMILISHQKSGNIDEKKHSNKARTT